MQRKIYAFIPALAIAVFLFTAFGGGGESKYQSGAPAANTGSPGDGKNCARSSCHPGSATNQSGIITSTIPAQGYTPASTYTITVTLTGSGKKGFEVSPQNISGDLLGTLTAGSGNKLVGSGKYCTQSSSVQGSPATWNFSWTAPVAGTGEVIFYGAFAIGISVTKLSTLVVQENTALPFSVEATATPGIICAGQSSQLDVTASGGSGTYTYSWNSLPPGFTSSIKNPVVYPDQTTQYLVQVDDGSQTLTDTTQVGVTAPPSVTAGTDTTYCVTVTEIPLQGTASGYSALEWTTSGDGTFGSPGSLVTFYYPGPNDKNNGSVHLTLTASPLSPCTSTVSATRIILFDPCGVGVPGLTGNPFTIALHPNPSNGIFTISGSCMKNSDVLIRIIAPDGKIVMTENLMINGDKLDHRIDLSSFSKGIYSIRLETNDGATSGKIIIQ